MDRTEKREFVSSLAEVFAATSMVVVTQNNGLTVAEVTKLRTQMRAAGATFRVAKNRLATLALDGTRFESIKPMLKGPTALAWSHDPVGVAKVAVEFARTNEKLVLIGGALGTQMLNADGSRRSPNCRAWTHCAGNSWGCLLPRRPASQACFRHRLRSSLAFWGPMPQRTATIRRPRRRRPSRNQSASLDCRACTEPTRLSSRDSAEWLT